MAQLNTGGPSKDTAEGTRPLFQGYLSLTTIFSPHLSSFTFAFSLCLSLHILTLSSSGAIGRIRGGNDKQRDNGVRPCQLPAWAWRILHGHGSSGCITSIQTGGEDSTNLFIIPFLYKHREQREWKESEPGIHSVQIIKTAPRGKVTFEMVAAILRKG